MEQLKTFEKKVDALGQLYLVKKAPFQLPENIKEIIVKYGPYLSLLFLILSLPAVLAAFGLGAIFAPFRYFGNVHFSFYYLLSITISLVGLILNAIALPGLFKRQLSAWRFVWYASVLSILNSLLGLHLISALISVLVSFYFLYQIKSLYH